MTIARAVQTVLCYIPMYIVLALIAVDWYTFCISFSKEFVEDPWSAGAVLHWVMLVLFNMVVPMLVWSYLKCIFTATSVSQCPPSSADMEHVAATTSDDGASVRRCRKCHSVKPHRAHHCSICGV